MRKTKRKPFKVRQECKEMEHKPKPETSNRNDDYSVEWRLKSARKIREHWDSTYRAVALPYQELSPDDDSNEPSLEDSPLVVSLN